MIDDNCVDGGGVNGHIVKTRTGMLQTANDVQISQDNISVRSLLSHLALTSTTADINSGILPLARIYAACTRETIVVAMQVEKIIISRRRRSPSIRARKSLMGRISEIKSAITSAALD